MIWKRIILEWTQETTIKNINIWYSLSYNLIFPLSFHFETVIFLKSQRKLKW